MHLGRFHHTIYLLQQEYEQSEFKELLTSLINTLSTLSSNPGNQNLADEFRTRLDSLRSILLSSQLNNPRPTLATMLKSIHADRYVGKELFARIQATIHTNQLAPAVAARALKELLTDVDGFYMRVNEISHAFDELEVEYDEIDEGGSEIGLLLPSTESNKTLKDLAKEVNTWHSILSTISEVFDPDNTTPTIRVFSTTDWLFYLYATPPLLLGISFCIKGVNHILRDLIRSRELIKELAGVGTSEKIIKEIENENDKKLETKINELAEIAIKDHYKGNDEGRKNELRNALHLALNQLTKKIASGAKVELRLEPPKRPEIDDGAKPTSEQKKQIAEIEKLESISTELATDATLLEFKAEEAAQLSLPSLENDEPENSTN